MQQRGALCLVTPDGTGHWLTPRAGAFEGLRALDGLWLEHLLDDTTADVTYQHGIHELYTLMTTDDSVTAAVLIRPVGVDEIERTALRGAADAAEIDVLHTQAVDRSRRAPALLRRRRSNVSP